jgi:peptidoglycan/LPS O-acetylase OafA/YrhL
MINYFNSVNLIRHIAAIFVIYAHSFELLQHQNIEYIKEIFSIDIGSLAVNIFFFLSGLLIYKSAINSDSLLNYFKKRFLRIYPALLFCIIITSFIFWILSSKSFYDFFTTKINIEYILNLFFIGKYSIIELFDANYYPFVANGSLWTLRYEIIMYAITSIFVFSFFKKSLYLPIIIFSIFLFLYIFTLDDSKSFTTNIARLGSYFFCGVLLSRFNYLKYKTLILLVILLSLLIFIYTNNYNEIFLLIFISFSLKLGLDYIQYREYNQKKINFDISYGLYIYAFPIQQLLVKYLEFNNVYTYFVSALVVTSIAATISWLFIEEKALRLKYAKTI